MNRKQLASVILLAFVPCVLAQAQTSTLDNSQPSPAAKQKSSRITRASLEFEPTHAQASVAVETPDPETKVAPTPLRPVLARKSTPADTSGEAPPKSSPTAPQTLTRQLALRTKVTAPDATLVKQPARIVIEVINDGPEISDAALLMVELPAHVALSSSQPQPTECREAVCEFPIEPLPNQSTQQITLEIVPTSTDPIQIRTEVRLMSCQEIGIRVDRPELLIHVAAPEFSFQNSENLYSVEVCNPSSVELKQLKITAEIPDGLNVTTLNRAANVDDQKRTLTWELDSLGGHQTELVQFQAVSTQTGSQCCRITAETTESEPSAVKISTTIDARPDLKIELNASTGPIQIDQTATVELLVENRGTAAASGVEWSIIVPEGLKPVESSEYSVQGNRLVFPAEELAGGATRTIPLRLTGGDVGEHVVRAQIQSPTHRAIVTEDSVFVYDAALPPTASMSLTSDQPQ
jgi:hypothetical protein